ncbi:hypothetical protein GCM10011581_42940 [Saccharopolyspora subtropica]|uniref:Uncharacterized protein n=1 Tax=Saccharopolyspora thermophila TaxID=89367 RepID=A0A917K7L2_9PSEU|nr:hypothetical protein [Saccharopolyspora subtropica]GGJ01154.1 hypothetical protein GCM10011581_42940 [Saccharopolyspora subtropica]
MDVRTLDGCAVTVFDDCAAKWRQLADALGDCRADGSTKPAAALDLAWLGEAADSAKAELAGHGGKLAAAADAAEAIAAALRTAAGGFRTAQGQLRQALRQAPGVGVRIEQNGTAVPLPGHQPDKRDITELTQLAQGALRSAEQTDQALANALLQHSRPVLRTNTGAPGGMVAMLKAAATQITGWWHGLNPVDRAFLWQHAGTELQNAGVLSPATQPKFDIGSGKHGAWKQGLAARYGTFPANALATIESALPRYLDKTLADLGDAVGWDLAAGNMRHYLGNSGKPREMDVEYLYRSEVLDWISEKIEEVLPEPTTKNIADDGSDSDTPAILRERVNALIDDKAPAWKKEAIDAFHKSGGQPVALEKQLEWKPQHTSLLFQPDGYFAYGSYHYTVTGVVKAEPDNEGNPKVSLDYQIHTADRYNWNWGQPVLMDHLHGISHKLGNAQEFDMQGSSKLRSIPLD